MHRHKFYGTGWTASPISVHREYGKHQGIPLKLKSSLISVLLTSQKMLWCLPPSFCSFAALDFLPRAEVFTENMGYCKRGVRGWLGEKCTFSEYEELGEIDETWPCETQLEILQCQTECSLSFFEVTFPHSLKNGLSYRHCSRDEKMFCLFCWINISCRNSETEAMNTYIDISKVWGQ